MQDTLIVTGGRRNTVPFSTDRLAYCYEAGVYRIDFKGRRISQSYLEKDLNEEIYVPEYTLSFRGACIHGNEIITCTHSEIVTLDLANLVVKSRVSSRLFNDLHSVMRHGSDILFASTGIDMVGRIASEGDVSIYPVMDGAADRFDGQVDYRKVCTKPHSAHPNSLFSLDDEIWVTRLVQKDAVCLGELTKRIEVGIERPHDGVVRDDSVYFTTVDGKIVECDIRKGAPVLVHDIASLYHSENPGWCRGLALDGDYAYVGFTTIRKTRNLENLCFLTDAARMTIDRVKNMPPSRVVKYNLKKGRIEGEMRFRPSEVGVIFSVLKPD